MNNVLQKSRFMTTESPCIEFAVSSSKMQSIAMPINTFEVVVVEDYKPAMVKKILESQASPSVGSFTASQLGKWLDSL
jgi:hypothetical protein